jgi:hypothetical protein
MDTYVAPNQAIRTSRILVGVIVVTFVGALALGVALATRAISFDSLTTTSSQDALVRVHAGFGPGYPPHYGLAGPSGVVRGDYPMGGAPVHGGLAGPSGVRSSSDAPPSSATVPTAQRNSGVSSASARWLVGARTAGDPSITTEGLDSA